MIEELSTTSKRLQSDGDGLRWSAPESWHITLQFLGNANQEQFECVVARLREVHLPSVPISLERLGFFERTGIFFASVRLTAELLHLQERVTSATEHCGFLPEDRPYQPHITLARSKGRGKRQDHHVFKTKIRRQPTFTRFVAEEFLLYESFLGPAGSLYEIRERFSLIAR